MRFPDEDSAWWFPAVIATVFVAVAVVVLAIGVTVNAIGRHQTQAICRAWGQDHDQTSTKFASYSWWSYECLARTPSGQWIGTDRWATTVIQGER